MRRNVVDLGLGLPATRDTGDAHDVARLYIIDVCRHEHRRRTSTAEGIVAMCSQLYTRAGGLYLRSANGQRAGSFLSSLSQVNTLASEVSGKSVSKLFLINFNDNRTELTSIGLSRLIIQYKMKCEYMYLTCAQRRTLVSLVYHTQR